MDEVVKHEFDYEKLTEKEKKAYWYLNYIKRSGYTLDDENKMFRKDKEVMQEVVMQNPILIKECPYEWRNDLSFVNPILSSISNHGIYMMVIKFLGDDIKDLLLTSCKHSLGDFYNSINNAVSKECQGERSLTDFVQSDRYSLYRENMKIVEGAMEQTVDSMENLLGERENTLSSGHKR